MPSTCRRPRPSSKRRAHNGATLLGCDFSGADLTGATLNGLRIESARMDGTKLTSAQARLLSSREVNLERATIFDELVLKDRRTLLVSRKGPHFVEYEDDQGNVVTASITDHARASVRAAYFNLDMLLNAWVQSLSYEEAVRRFGGLGIPVLALASEHGDSYLALDIIALVGFDRVPSTRHERVAELRASSFLNRWSAKQREVLDTIVEHIDKKTIHSAFIESNALQPIVESLGGTKHVFQAFGGEEFYRNAVKDLERALLTYL